MEVEHSNGCLVSESQNPSESSPFRNYLIGVGIPGAIILFMAAAGLAVSVFFYGNDTWGEHVDIIRISALLGAFASFLGIGEIVMTLLTSDGRFLPKLFQVLGYLTVWSVAFVLLFWVA